MQDTNDIAVIIPAYNPESSFPRLIEDLAQYGFFLIVVNDGSEERFQILFEEIKKHAVVLQHEKNRGKGNALKTGIRYLEKHAEGVKGFVTADADGQHSVRDIVRVSDRIGNDREIILGTRELNRGVPVKSRVGNLLSRYVFAVVTGKYLEDNQTGLRGFPVQMCGFLASVSGSFYDYEMNVLVKAARKGYRFVSLPIETIYREGNSTSHFHPVRDTLRIHAGLLKNGLISLALYACVCAAILLGFHFRLEERYILSMAAALCLVHVLLKRKELGTRSGIILVKYIVIYVVFRIWRSFAWNFAGAVILILVLLPAITCIYAMAAWRRSGTDKEGSYETL